MPPKSIPNRWLNYSPVGKKIRGTRFIAFKVPLREKVANSVEDRLRLSCESLVRKIPNLGMIIDLTNTNRYYSPEFFIEQGIRYGKLMIPGHQIPPRNLVQKFNMMVKDFLRSNSENNKLIGVHCTHGVNRTGYLICKFMISEMNIQAMDAVHLFHAARGHQIERQNYVQDLTGSEAAESTTLREPSSNLRNSQTGKSATNSRRASRTGEQYSNWRNSQTGSNTTNSRRASQTGEPSSNWRNRQTGSSTTNSRRASQTGESSSNWRNRQTGSSATNSRRASQTGEPSSNWRNIQTERSMTNSTRVGQTYGEYRRSQASNRSSAPTSNSQTNGRWRSSKQAHDRLYPDY